MQEVFEKIIEELEIERTTANNTFVKYEMNVDLGRVFGLEKAIEIVKQEAEKYNNGWIPVKYHDITDEEREERGISEDIAYLLDCKLPENEEEILITRKWRDGYIVEHDMCMVDDGYFLESVLDWIDVIAWMPLPQPYQPKGE